MQYLSAEDVLNIHSVIIDETGGVHGVRSREALLALEGLPKQVAFGKELYPGLFLKAAVYVRNTIFGHSFVDGNKRTAMTCMGVFLQLNDWHIAAQPGEIEIFALAIISERYSLEHIADWIQAHSVPGTSFEN